MAKKMFAASSVDIRTLKMFAREETKTTVIARKLRRSVAAVYLRASELAVMLGRPREERVVVSKREVVREDERASERCVHCEISNVDIAERALPLESIHE